jgi:LPPG:FO 2-phospho-L-lactate transferase
MSSPKVVFLSGGTGTPKLLQGIKDYINPHNITVIGNTGDDWSFYGLHVSPDVDSVLFTLSNMIDRSKWWGIKNDSFNMVKSLREALKEDIWFNLGDQDTGICLYRTWLMNEGYTLTEATNKIAKKLNIQSKILPMANQTIKTIIETEEQNMHLQEYWVRYKGKPEVINVFFEGDLYNTTAEVQNSIKEADYIILGPSNPISSIGPIIGIHPIKEALRTTKGKKIAVSPIIGENAISGPTSKFLKAWGYKVSPLSIIQLYQDFIDVFILNESDRNLTDSIKELGVTPIFEEIIIRTSDDAKRIMRKILE